MIYECNIFCATMDEEQAELMAIEDKGMWLPYAFILETVIAIKLTTLDEDELPYGCTTIYTDDDRTFIIDTPFDQFKEIWKKAYESAENTTEA